ncbi:MAG: DciA family protein [Methylosarcina sp.]
MPFRTAQSFPNRLLAHYFSQLEQQQLMLQLIREVLPDPLAQHVLHCVKNDKKLLVYTDSAAWASQLRFYKSPILTVLAATNGQAAENLQVRIFTEEVSPEKEGLKKANTPSVENIALIHNHGETIDDEELKQSLRKLSATLARL